MGFTTAHKIDLSKFGLFQVRGGKQATKKEINLTLDFVFSCITKICQVVSASKEVIWNAEFQVSLHLFVRLRVLFERFGNRCFIQQHTIEILRWMIQQQNADLTINTTKTCGL